MYVYFNIRPGTTESIARKTWYYRTMISLKKNVEHQARDEVEQVLTTSRHELTFMKKVKSFAKIELKSEYGEAAKLYALQNIKTEE